ncbi:type I restriction endonuclease subunit R [Hyphomonas sp.]|uniref:type I restriction endonuclease subunit R n=1 Tax=Hyphomonas sp. TaxID=87 RepID=UPI003002953D
MTGYQSESQLEEALIDRLCGLGYERVTIRNTADLQANLKRQLEKHNADVLGATALSDGEFEKVLNHLAKGSVFEKAKTLRDRMQLTRDDGSTAYLRFMNTEHWCQNEYQVTHQVTVQGAYKTRYDVTLLINGLPLVQIELKRRGLEIAEAFNQVNRYHRHSYGADNALFQYVQIFVISNGVNTKYYANNRHQSFKQTFYWSDAANNLVTGLEPFADAFLEKCHISKMIAKYIVLHESDKLLMVLRPYQFYAVEAIVDRVKAGRKHGYIWHTTGSGKTLTSFKAAQVLMNLPKVDKVVFVVDRTDLDDQTTREFNAFSEGSVDGTDNTAALVRQLSGDTPLIVTTIQKLNTAITREHHAGKLDDLRRKRIVFIFDECHRSQFGKTHKAITEFFEAAQMFGFTGTPIFAENASKNEHGKRTTKDLFTECLHKYVITNAIADQNVLRFAVEYWGKLRRKDGSLIDEDVAGINTREFFEHPDRVEQVVDWIITNHDRKTHKKHFSSIMCVGSVDGLLTYYDAFKRRKEAGDHDLRVATVFTFQANEPDKDADGQIEEVDFVADSGTGNEHTRDRLAACVADYNEMFGENQSVKDGKAFYTYFRNLSKRMKGRDKADNAKDRIDILLVVNMFLTGFDVKRLNTIYVDKNLKYHGLIQAFSRTNRTLGQLKSQGNVVCFRNLKEATDTAIRMFSDKNPVETILLEPYEHYRDQFNAALEALLAIAPSVDSVDGLISEEDQLRFVKAFRAVMRLRNVLTGFSEYNATDLQLHPQAFEDYKSKYLDIHDRVKKGEDGETVSIVDEIDFELELIQRDEINVAYILNLLNQANKDAAKGDTSESERKRDAVLNLLGNEPQLRSKRELIEKFIRDYMPSVANGDSIEQAFATYWAREKEKAIGGLCEEEGLERGAIDLIIKDYRFTGREPLPDNVVAAMIEKPRILERRRKVRRVSEKAVAFVHQFEEGIGGV